MTGRQPGKGNSGRVQGSWVSRPKWTSLALQSGTPLWSVRRGAHGWTEWLLAGVDVSHAFTPPAANIAAPDELALAPLHVSDHVGVVASTTAEEVAATRALRRAVAFSALCPRDPNVLILYAVVGRLMDVEQILLADRYFPLVLFSPTHFPFYFV